MTNIQFNTETRQFAVAGQLSSGPLASTPLVRYVVIYADSKSGQVKSKKVSANSPLDAVIKVKQGNSKPVPGKPIIIMVRAKAFKDPEQLADAEKYKESLKQSYANSSPSTPKIL